MEGEKGRERKGGREKEGEKWRERKGGREKEGEEREKRRERRDGREEESERRRPDPPLPVNLKVPPLLDLFLEREKKTRHSLVRYDDL
jgi:hypothetical protein